MGDRVRSTSAPDLLKSSTRSQAPNTDKASPSADSAPRDGASDHDNTSRRSSSPGTMGTPAYEATNTQASTSSPGADDPHNDHDAHHTMDAASVAAATPGEPSNMPADAFILAASIAPGDDTAHATRLPAMASAGTASRPAIPSGLDQPMTDARDDSAIVGCDQLITDDMASPDRPPIISANSRKRVRLSFVRRQRDNEIDRRRRARGAGMGMDGSLNDNGQSQTGMRRLFQLRQHAQNIITRSMSQMTDVSQRGAMSDLLSESGESHLKEDTHYVNKHIQTLFPTTFAGAQAQAFGHKTTFLAAAADTHSLVDSQSSASVSSTISALDKPVYLRRRRNELKFLEFCENGEYRERSLPRQDILNEVHGLPNEVPDFIAAGHMGNKVPNSKRNFTPIQRSAHHHPDKPKFEAKINARDHRQDRNTNQKRQAPAAADPTISLQTKRGHDHLRLRSSRMSLTMRDMRQVDPAFTAKAALWVRQKCIVVSLEHVRAIILHNKLLLFDPDNESVKQPIAYIQQRLAQGVRNSDEAFMPFEFRALEGILIHSCISVERDFHKIERSLVGGILETLPTHSSPEHLERLRVEEQSLNYFNARLRKFQTVLQTLLDSDEDMANMYLTEKQKTPLVGGRNAMDHDEAEMLLESYLQVADDISTKAGLLNRAIDDTENLIEIHLNTNQNKLLQITVTISVVMLLIGFATMIFGIFGMNLPMVDKMHNLPDSQYFFYGTAGLTVLALGISAVSIAKWSRHQGQGLFKWQRLRLGAHRPRAAAAAVVVVGPKVPFVGDAHVSRPRHAVIPAPTPLSAV